MWTIFKVFIDFVTILLLFHVLVFSSLGMWDSASWTKDSGSPTKDRSCTPSIGRQSPDHWTTREISASFLWGEFYLLKGGFTA